MNGTLWIPLQIHCCSYLLSTCCRPRPTKAAPPSAAPAGEQHRGPEEGAAGDDAALRDGELSAKEDRGAEETPAPAAAGIPVTWEPGARVAGVARVA